jgi:hypothetical protein
MRRPIPIPGQAPHASACSYPGCHLAAIRGGEFRAGLELEAVIDALYDPAFFRLLVGHGKLDKLGRSALPKSSSTAARRLWSGSCDPFRPIAQRIDQQGKANLGWRRLGCLPLIGGSSAKLVKAFQDPPAEAPEMARGISLIEPNAAKLFAVKIYCVNSIARMSH